MKVSLLGPTNLEKFSKITGLSLSEIGKIAKQIGYALAEEKCTLVVVFNYGGMLKLVGDAFKEKGGRMEMLYTENGCEWEAKPYLHNLKCADVKAKKGSWHEVILSLVSDSDLVICAGLSAGCFVELGYMKWNYQDKRGKVKALIGIKELLREGKIPPEISMSMGGFADALPVKGLKGILAKFSPKRP